MLNSGLLSLERTFMSSLFRSYSQNTASRPIIDKSELDSIKSDDLRHYQIVEAPDGYESNAMSYDPRMHKFIKILMKNGNSYLARNLVDKALYNIKLKQVERYNKTEDENKRKEIETNPMRIFLNAMDNTKPMLKVIGLIKSGISYQVPVPMSDKEREFKATRFILSSSREKDTNVRFYDKLADELIEAFNNQGKSIKKKVDMHKLAEANRAYAHFRWAKK